MSEGHGYPLLHIYNIYVRVYVYSMEWSSTCLLCLGKVHGETIYKELIDDAPNIISGKGEAILIASRL